MQERALGSVRDQVERLRYASAASATRPSRRSRSARAAGSVAAPSPPGELSRVAYGLGYEPVADTVARRGGFEPPTARSVVLYEPSPLILPIPSHHRWCWSTAVLVIRVVYLSPPRTCGMVAMWSQFRAAVARPAIWQAVALRGQLTAEHQIPHHSAEQPGLRRRVASAARVGRRHLRADGPA
jgi:hypothetical protein